MQTPWYTPKPDFIHDHLHLRLYGSLESIWELGMALHERTPLLEHVAYPKADHGILFACVDPQMRHRLDIQQSLLGGIHQRSLLLPEIWMGSTLLHPFRLADMPVRPYQAEIGTLQLRSTTLEGKKERYYRIIDTPTAEIAQQLAPFFPVYCFSAKTTQLTYVAMGPRRLHRIRPALQQAFPAVSISLRFDLPYESTSSVSPIQRLVHYEPYLSREGYETSVTNQFFRMFGVQARCKDDNEGFTEQDT